MSWNCSNSFFVILVRKVNIIYVPKYLDFLK